MKGLYSFLSLLLTAFILVGCVLLDVIIGKEILYEFLSLIDKADVFKLNLILFVFSLVFLCGFGIIFVLYIRKNSKYIMSSFVASGFAIMFFTMFFNSFDIVKNFYFASNEFSLAVKSSIRNISIANFSIGGLLILITIFYFIRRNKYEEKC